jgi:hypothetical protein
MRPLKPEAFEQALPGLQLAVFEIVWPVFPELTQVLGHANRGDFEVALGWEKAPSADDLQNCEYLVKEVFQVAFGPDAVIRFASTEDVRTDDYEELMSASLFIALATRFAPHRLDIGR